MALLDFLSGIFGNTNPQGLSGMAAAMNQPTGGSSFFSNLPPGALAQLGASIAGAPRNQWGVGLAGGIANLSQQIEAEKKRKGMAAALQAASAGMNPQQQALITTLAQNGGVEAAAPLVMQKLFKPSAQWETILGPDGKPAYQRNSQTGEIKGYALTPEEQLGVRGLGQGPAPIPGTGLTVDPQGNVVGAPAPQPGGGSPAPQPRGPIVLSGEALKRMNLPAPSSGNQWALDPQSLQPIQVPIPGAEKPAKPLPTPMTDKLSELGRTVQILKDTTGTFKDQFAGYGASGQTAMDLGAISPGGAFGMLPSEDAVTWWKEYQNNKNLTRHALFGGALQPNEQQQFDAADISPNMDPKIIKKNLEIQAKLAARGIERLSRSAVASGYSKDAVEAASGVSLPEATQVGQTGSFTPTSADQAATAQPPATVSAQPNGQGTPPQALALPQDKTMLRPGAIYQTVRGPAKYLGNGQFQALQ